MDVGVMLVVGAAVVGAGALVRWRQPVAGFASRAIQYLSEVRAEVRKVTWPGRDELRKSTLVIIIFVIIIGLVIGAMDWLFSLILVRWLGRAFA